MKLHQKSSQGSGWITTYMEWEYQMPKKFEDYVYVSLIMQGHGIRQGLEAHRRNRPYCMGTLYWQLNDNWPVISWSGIDYYGNWKALHYQAKRVFAPLFVDVYQKENQLEVWLMSDCLDTKEGMTLEMQLTDFYGKVQKKEKRTVVAPSNSSVKVAQLSMEDWVSSEEKNSCYLLLTLRDKKGQKISEEPYFFVVPKELKLPETTVSSQIKVKNGVCEVTLKSDALAKDLFIDFPIHGARFSDNFFDLLPKKSRKITITSPLIKAGEPLEIKIKHLQAIY
jgi:beta-mannosidase